MQTYSQEQRSIKEVYEHVAILFKDHPDLLTEFTHFLPDHGNQAGQGATQAAGARGRGKGKVGAGRRPPHTTAAKKEQDLNQKEADFFASVKRQLRSQQRYEELLKSLRLFTDEMISRDELIDLAKGLFGQKHDALFHSFKQFIGDITQTGGRASMTPQEQEAEARRMKLWQQQPLSRVTDSSCEQFGPSYRHLPPALPRQQCSGRQDDLLCDSVLNDKWIAAPSTDGHLSAGETPFELASRNKYEKDQFKCEDERFELDLLLQSNASVLDELEVINSELARHPPEDRLKLSLSDTSLHAVHKRCIERVYGPDFDEQILKLLHRNPAVAVPVVLDRLRKKQDEWTRLRIECRRQWKETTADLHVKALDHRSFYFKQMDEKSLDEKSLLVEIGAQPAGTPFQFKLPCCSTVQGNAVAAVQFLLEKQFDDGTARDCAALMHDLLRGVYGLSWLETELSQELALEFDEDMDTDDDDGDDPHVLDSVRTEGDVAGGDHSNGADDQADDMDVVESSGGGEAAADPSASSAVSDAGVAYQQKDDASDARASPGAESTSQTPSATAGNEPDGGEGGDNEKKGSEDGAASGAADTSAADGSEAKGAAGGDEDTADDEAAEPATFQGSDDETDHSEEDGGFDDDGTIDDNGQDEISDLEDASDMDDGDDDGPENGEQGGDSYQPREFVYEMAKDVCSKTAQRPVATQSASSGLLSAAKAAELASRVEAAKQLYRTDADSATPAAVKPEPGGPNNTEGEGPAPDGDTAENSRAGEAGGDGEPGAVAPDAVVRRGRSRATTVFYGNKAFYLFFRHHQRLCERMNRASQMAERAHKRRSQRSEGDEALGTQEKFLCVLTQLLTSASGSPESNDDSKLLFEDRVRRLLGTNAYTLYTLGAVVEHTVRGLHALTQADAGDGVCQRLIELHALHTARAKLGGSSKGLGTMDVLDGIYRESVCELLGPDTECYKFEWCAPSNRRRSGTLTIRLVERGAPGPALPAAQIDEATQYASKLAAAGQDGTAPGVFLARNLKRCTAPTRAARLAGVVQQHGLEMSVSVPSADATGEEDETAAAQRGYKGIVSASKRRRTTKPAGAPRRVVYVVS